MRSVSAAGGEHENRDVGACADPSEHFEPVHLRQIHIQDDGVEAFRYGPIGTAAAIMLSHDSVSERFEVSLDQRAKLLVIVDHQHLRRLAPGGRRSERWTRWQHEQDVHEQTEPRTQRSVAAGRLRRGENNGDSAGKAATLTIS